MIHWPIDSRTPFPQTRWAADSYRDTIHHMPATPADLFGIFDRLGIEHSTGEHPPFSTVEEGRPGHNESPGRHLFIKDRKGGIWLVVMPADKRANLEGVEKVLGPPRF